MSGPGGLLNSAKKTYGLKPPPGSSSHLEPDPQPGPNPQPNPNPQPGLQPNPDPQPNPETPAAHEAGNSTRLPRSPRHLAEWAWAVSRPMRTANGAVILILISVVLATVAWPSTPQICPSGDFDAPPPQNRGDGWAARHERATDMYSDATRWLRYFQGQAELSSRGNNALATARAAEIAERTSRLASSTSTLKKKFETSGLDEASGLRYLEARLLRGLNEARFYQDAAWPRLLRLGCTSCGPVTHTPPCPDHPAAVATREIREVRNVLSDISNAHGDLISQHRAIQRGSLKPAHDDICVGGQWSRLRATAFGICRLTGRELHRGTEFRDEFASTVGDRLNTALNDVNDISNELDGVYPDYSWSPGDVARGAAALDSLLHVVTAQMDGG